MTFRWQGKTYDTTAMKHYATGNPAMPFVYVTRDGGRAFVARIDRLEGVEMRAAGAAEVKALAERHGIPELLDVVGEAPSGEDASPPPGPEWHALIVEDDGTSRHALGKLLNHSGWRTSSAATLAEAQAKLSPRPQYLILDLNLPDGVGADLLQQVRDERIPIKVAVTTATTDPALLAKVKSLRPDAIFMKPLDLPQLLNWMEAA